MKRVHLSDDGEVEEDIVAALEHLEPAYKRKRSTRNKRHWQFWLAAVAILIFLAYVHTMNIYYHRFEPPVPPSYSAHR